MSAKFKNFRGFLLANTACTCNNNIIALAAVDLSYSGSGVKEFEEEEDGFTVDFDVLGFMRDQDTYRRIRSTGVLNFTDEDVSIANIMTDGHE